MYYDTEIGRARGVQDYLRKKGKSRAEWFDEVSRGEVSAFELEVPRFLRSPEIEPVIMEIRGFGTLTEETILVAPRGAMRQIIRYADDPRLF